MRLSELTERLFLDKSTTSRVVQTLVKKGYVEQRPDATDGRATALHPSTKGRRLCERITDDLVEQQKQLLQDLDPEIRAGVVNVIRRVARAADSRFRSGVSVGADACCGPSGGGTACLQATWLLLTAVSRRQLRDKGSDVTMRVGQERWIPAGSTVTFENVGSQSSEFLRFDFKTKPIASSH